MKNKRINLSIKKSSRENENRTNSSSSYILNHNTNKFF